MRVLVAASPLKGSLGARTTARALTHAVRSAHPGAKAERVLVADGGDGTARILAGSLGGARRLARVCGALGEPRDAAWYLAPGGVGILDLASSCGIGLPGRRRLDPLRASTRGLGDLVRAALDGGARTLWVGLGGSASTDGGAGAAAALGVRFLDRSGAVLEWGGAALCRLHRIDRSDVDPRIARSRILLLADVLGPLLGPSGAARVFGPQKGASPADVSRLERGLSRLARLAGGVRAAVLSALPGAGAAGGSGAGLAALLDAEIRPGAATVLDLARFDLALARADAVLCCEGRYEGSRHPGKVTEEVLLRCGRAGVPAAVVCGSRAPRAAAPRGSLVVSAERRLDAEGLAVLARDALRRLSTARRTA